LFVKAWCGRSTGGILTTVFHAETNATLTAPTYLNPPYVLEHADGKDRKSAYESSRIGGDAEPGPGTGRQGESTRRAAQCAPPARVHTCDRQVPTAPRYQKNMMSLRTVGCAVLPLIFQIHIFMFEGKKHRKD